MAKLIDVKSAILWSSGDTMLNSVRLKSIESVSSVVGHAVNVSTSPLCKGAPADLKKDANGFDLPIARYLIWRATRAMQATL